MKLKLLCALAVTMGLATFSARAADEAKAAAVDETKTVAADAAKPSVQSELGALVDRVRAKASAGEVTEAALADELKEFDRILAEHKGEKNDDVAQVLVLKAGLYLQLLNDFDKAAVLFKQLKADFPESSQAKEVDEILKAIALQQAAARIQESLKVGTPFPDFDEKDMAGNAVSVGKLKGNVVLVDFWATWCGPCTGEMPNVIDVYKKYHPRGFEIIGVSLDRDEGALKKYLADNKITWPQVFDGKFWESKLAGVYGVTSIPFTLLINGDGVIVGKNLRGPALGEALEKLLGP